MIVPLAMTIYFSFLRYNLLMPGIEEFAGFSNYSYFLTDPAFFQAIFNTLAIVLGGGSFITVDRRHMRWRFFSISRCSVRGSCASW